MEEHIIDIVRFVTCCMMLATGLVLMIKADDNNAMRRLSVILAIVLIRFNEQIGAAVYLMLGSTIETVIAAAGVGFVIILVVVIMLFPLMAAFRWLRH